MSMHLPEVRSGFAQENFSQKFELVLEVKGERQLACISVAAGSKGYTRPTWTSGVCFYQTSKVGFASFFCRSETKNRAID